MTVSKVTRVFLVATLQCFANDMTVVELAGRPICQVFFAVLSFGCCCFLTAQGVTFSKVSGD